LDAQPRGTLYEQVAALCVELCGEAAPPPVPLPQSGWSSARGLLGEYAGGAEYRRAERGREAAIVVHQSIIADPELLRLALAHELLHHWEHVVASDTVGAPPEGYPPEVGALVRRLLPDALRQRRWLERHSPRYVAQARTVCARLGIPLEAVLFRRSARG
jgi:hypothetical protein